MSDCSSDVVLAELGELKEWVGAIAAKVGAKRPKRGDFPEIIPAKKYSVSEAAALVGGSVQNIYRLLRIGDLKLTPTLGEKRVMGQDLIDFLKARAAKA